MFAHPVPFHAFGGLGGIVSYRAGSRVAVLLNDRVAVFHRPHSGSGDEPGSGQPPAPIPAECRGETMIDYKGYVGVFDFQPDSGSFHGTVVNTNDVISFYGSSVAELRREMRRSVEEYLAFCREQDRPPEKPFSGKMMLRTTPELHRKVALQAARSRLSMNAWLQEVLERAVAGD